MLTIRPILHKRKKKDGTHKVMICLYHPGLPRRYVPTSLSVAESHWNINGEIGKMNWVRASRSSHKTDNLLLAEKVELLRKLSIDNPTPNDILAALDVAAQEVIEAEIDKAQAELPPPCFKAYWESYIEENAYRWNLYWKPNQESALKVFAEFHPKALPFADIDNKLLNRFERWRLEKGRSKTTVAKELSNLRAVYNGAVRDKLASFADNPFNSYVIKHGAGEGRVAFTWKEIDLIEADTQVSKEEALSRDVFLFQFYGGGRRINEVLTLTWSDVGVDSFTYYQLKKAKRVRVSRELIAESRAILARYEHRKVAGCRYVFPVYADNADLMQKVVRTTAVSAVNDGLDSLAERLGLPHFSSHVARHSWTELARKSKVDLYGISKNLGHSKLAVTEVYMADFDQVAVETAHRAMIASRPAKEATNGPEMVA